MAKETVMTELKKGKCEFNLVGKVKISDFTFKMDCEGKNSDWIYHQLNLGVDCGKHGVIYADMMGGYGADRDNVVYAHGTKKNENDKIVDDYKKPIRINWEDRFDEEILDAVGQNCFITVGIEKDIEGKTVYKKFLSQYDAIQYIQENLKDGVTVNVKGRLTYQEYNGSISVKKEITSIALSKTEEDDFRATFTQTLLLDSQAIGKPDKETKSIPIYAMIIEYAKKHNDIKLEYKKNGEIKKGLNIPLLKTFDIDIEDKEKTTKMLKFFKAKSKKVTELTVDGIFTKGSLDTTEVNEDDIPEDIKELIEMGLIEKSEVMDKIAFSNGGKKKERMVIVKPHIDMIKSGEQKLPHLAREEAKYTEEEVCFQNIVDYYQIESNQEKNTEDEDIKEDIDEEKAMEDALNEIGDDEEDDWLKDL